MPVEVYPGEGAYAPQPEAVGDQSADDSQPQQHLDQATIDSLQERLKTAPEGIGPTGQYPEGKLNEHDEGEIAIALGADKERKKILINFGTPVSLIGMNPAHARQLGCLLIAKAAEFED